MAPPTPPDPSAPWLGAWSRPADQPAQIALALACLLLVTALVPQGPRRLIAALDLANVGNRDRTRRFLVVSGLAAAFLSIGYVDVYLHGGPRGLDAPVYWLQGRILSHGAFSWAVPSPMASYRATGFIATSPDRVSGIFPPGYPLLLAAGFLVGAPMLVGPLIAGCLVVATWLLGGELSEHAGERSSSRYRRTAGLAAGLSVVCAALREQTAETLPHGAVALAIAVALASALRGWRRREPRLFAIAGVALGWLVSARPMAAVAIGLVTAALIVRSTERRQAMAWSFLAAAPGAALLLAANRAATGHLFISPAALYAQSVVGTGTPFAYGAHRFALTIGALRGHLMDIANFEPLSLALVLAISNRRRTMASTCAALVVVGQLAVQAIGAHATVARFGDGLSEVLPLEHALLAYGVAATFWRSFDRVATVVLGLALGGFALHAAPAHAAAGSSDIGRPHFEPDVLQQAGVTTALLFFDDDQGFELAAVPGLKADRGIQAALLRGDDHDRLAYDMAETAGHSTARRYVATANGASVLFWSPPSSSPSFWRFEAESDWPPMTASWGAASRLQVTTSCVSGAGALALTPVGPGDATLALELPVPAAPMGSRPRVWTVTPRIYDVGPPGEGSLDVVVDSPTNPPLAHWSWRGESKSPSCHDLAAAMVELGRTPARAWLILTARGGEVALDRTLLR